MSGQFFKFVKHCFITGCAIAALILISKCLYEYSLNKDTSSIAFKRFHSDANSLYPSISLCFKEKLYSLDKEDKFVQSYREFLSGCKDSPDCIWNSSFANVDYDAVTTNLLDYIITEETTFSDDSKYWYVYKKFPERGTVSYNKTKIFYGYTGSNRVYTSRRMGAQTCITLDIPFKKDKRVSYHSILLDESVFEENKRPKKSDFEVSFHYPKQISRQTATKYIWTNVSKLLNKPCDVIENGKSCAYYGSSYTMVFEVDNVSVLKLRATGKRPCIKNWRNDDMEWKSMISRKLKCKPNHWMLPLNSTICSKKEDMKSALFMEEDPNVPSCNNMERYSFDYSETSGLNAFDIGIQEFNDTLGIDWTDENLNNKIFSEIDIHFVG